MIITALCRYYDILLDSDTNNEIPRFGFSRIGVSFALNISEDGDLLNIIDLRQGNEKGKKLIPVYMIVPEQAGRAGIKPRPYFLCDDCSYVLGMDIEKDESKNSQKTAVDKFLAFKELHISILKNSENVFAKSIVKFLNKWEPLEIEKNSCVKEMWKELSGNGKIVFRVDGLFDYAHDQEELKNLWLERLLQNNKDSKIGQCLVTGEKKTIAKLHAKIKGIKGGAAESPLIAFNSAASNAYDSYGKENAYNSPVSEEAVFKYTRTLNYLLSSDRKIQIGDATTIFWAESPKNIYSDIAMALIYGAGNTGNSSETANEDAFDKEKENMDDISGRQRDVNTERIVRDILKCVREGKNIHDVSEDIDENTKFYILGLFPNAGRIAARFIYTDSFGNFIKNMNMHYEDVELENGPKYVEIRKILNETIPRTSKDKEVSPKLGGDVMRSIITGSAYPYALYSAIIERIRSERDDRETKFKSVNPYRVAIIKAYLKRNARIHKNKKYEEVLTVGLNEQSKNQAYLLGRLFALLERAQEEASKNELTRKSELNSTIKDRYFSTASTSPRAVFPTLIRLSQHHISKIEKSTWLEILMGEVMDGLETFPAHLNIEEQGLFILGYYHQRQALFKKNDDKHKNNELEGGNENE